MKVFIKILIRFLVLIALFFVFNEIYKKTYWPKDVTKHADLLDSLQLMVPNSDVLYFGESSNFAVHHMDIDDARISDFIAFYYPDLNFGTVNKGAIHADVYYNLLNNVPKDAPVKTIIITLNLRSFDAMWIYSDLESFIQKSIVMMKKYPPLVNRSLLAFKAYDSKSKNEREAQFKHQWKKDELNFPYDFPYKNVVEWDQAIYNSVPDKEQRDLAAHYVKAYAFQIDTLTNPRIKDYDKIVELAKKRNWNLVFNLMAENLEMADSLVGKDLVYLMKQNRDILVKRYKQMGVTVVDNLEKVGDAEFLDRDWTTEHYTDKGRKEVAKNVANEMRKFYPDQFYDYATNQVFFNGFENKNLWLNPKSITEEKALHGKRSTYVVKGNVFSSTFEKYIDEIKGDSVSISFYINKEAFKSSAQLAIEIGGNSFKWIGFDIRNYYHNEVEDWQKVEIKTRISDYFPNNNRLKIYFMNESETKVFVDDVRIEFY